MNQLSYDTNTGPMSSPRDFFVDTSPLANGLYDMSQGAGALVASDRRRKWEIAKEQEKIQQGNDALWVTKQLSDVQLQYVQKHEIDGQFDDPETFDTKWEENAAKIVGAAKTPEAAAHIERSLADMKASFGAQNARGVAGNNNRKAEEDFISTMQRLGDAGSTTGEYDSAAQNQQDLAEAVTGSSAAAQPFVSDIQTKAVTAASTHYGPGNAAQMLRNNQVGTKLQPTEKKLLAAQLDDDEVAVAATNVFQAQSAIADMETRAQAGDAAAIAALPEAKDQLQAATERLTFAQARPDSDNELLDHADELQAQGAATASRKGATLSMSQVDRAFSTIVNQATARGMRGASPEKLERLVKNRVERYGEGSPVTAFAMKAAAEQEKSFKEDPAAYVMQDGGLSNIIRSAANNPAQFSAAIDESLRRQADFAGRFGESPRRVLTKTMQLELGSKIKAMATGTPVELAPGNVRKATPDETVAFIDGLVRQYGHHGTAVLRELSENKDENSRIPTEALIAASLPPALGGVRTNLIKQLANTPEELSKMSGGENSALKKALAEDKTLGNFIASNMGVSAGGINGPAAVEWAGAVERTAQRLLITKAASNPRQAVKMATEQTIGAIWDIDGMLRVPKISQAGKIQDTAAVKAGLDVLTPALLPHLDTSYYNAPTAIFDQARAALLGQRKLSEQLSWVTSEDGYTAQLMARTMDGSLAQVKTKGGEDVVVSFERAKDVPRTSSARSIAVAGVSAGASGISAPRRHAEFNPLDYIFQVKKATLAPTMKKHPSRKNNSPIITKTKSAIVPNSERTVSMLDTNTEGIIP
jgi:hypothetical protein